MSFNINNIPSQAGRIAIVTGANAGLGFETAKVLASKSMKVILACRNIAKAEKAKNDILKAHPSADLDILQIDLSSLQSVRKFLKAYKAKYSQLDLLINNAGVMMPPYSKTEDGFELQMGANYFGHFLLTGLLLETIVKTPNSRIVSLSSLAHIKGRIQFDDLHWEKQYERMPAYRQSKVACLIFAFELQRRLEQAGYETISVAAHPGVTATELGRHFPELLYKILTPVVNAFTHKPKDGALPTLMAALDQDVKGGDYYGPLGFRNMSGAPGKAKFTSYSNDAQIGKQLWQISESLTKIEYL